jgi:hypothetical protein
LIDLLTQAFLEQQTMAQKRYDVKP